MSIRKYFDMIKEHYDFQVYMLRRFLSYTSDEIGRLEIQDGVAQLTRLYDDQMQEKITQLGMHGLDVKDAKQCGIEYKLWLSRKKKESGQSKKKVMEVDPEYARKIKESHQRHIDRVVGQRVLK